MTRTILIDWLMVNVENNGYNMTADNLEKLFSVKLTDDEKQMIAEDYTTESSFNCTATEIEDDVRVHLCNWLVVGMENLQYEDHYQLTAAAIEKHFDCKLTRNEQLYIDG